MGRLSYVIDGLEAMQRPAEAAEPTEKELHVQAITESLVDLTERLEKAIEGTGPIEPKDYTDSLARIAAALGQKTELGPLVQAIKGLSVSPQVNVAAPNVSVEVERAGPMLFEVRRDRDGYIQSVLARPYEDEPEDDSEPTYEIE
jgi:hypothetical protein